ncbi:uncharacterized protein LOC108667205 [Hyalella azteca]|uniref:Uncharacterized protein LOC108667205 n=1 Tax=Hyalella azteca TaxID=294128 RepID=A0A8B7N8X7_HYAAZ|nr:uncharacterized protein LOC108667205 [Hyalella azteca]
MAGPHEEKHSGAEKIELVSCMVDQCLFQSSTVIVTEPAGILTSNTGSSLKSPSINLNCDQNLPSLPTPPYTPQPLPSFVSMAFANETYGDLMEENNNMDENSNDEQYEQFSHFHQQHYLDQQASIQRRHELQNLADQPNRYNNSSPFDSEERRNESGSRRFQPPLQMALSSTLDHPINSVLERQHIELDTSSEPRSVRPRENYASQRRLSLNHNSTSRLDQFHSSGVERSQHPLSSFEPNQNLKPSSNAAVTSMPQKFSAKPPDESVSSSYFTHSRHNLASRHQRQRSCDSGLDHLLNSNSRDEGDQAQALPTLPRPTYHGACNGGIWNEGVPAELEMLESQTDTEREAQMLLYNFTREELSMEHLPVPVDIAQFQGYGDCKLMREGTKLRQIADAFQASPERAKVRDMASKVLISDITWENFAALCMELFSGEPGVTVERIVTLFTFIADIAKTQIRRGLQSCIRQLMTWSLRFIFQKVCQWVDNSGGWGRVLQQGLDVVYKVAVSVCAGVAVVAMAAYIAKTWRS